jgi:N-carbamoyl-L-amino-acid hydrolase
MAIRNTDSGIDGGRFWSTVMRSGEIGPGKAGGLCRLALTDADKEMRDLFITWCTEVGCTVQVDRVGNIFARRPGAEAATKQQETRGLRDGWATAAAEA